MKAIFRSTSLFAAVVQSDALSVGSRSGNHALHNLPSELSSEGSVVSPYPYPNPFDMTGWLEIASVEDAADTASTLLDSLAAVKDTVRDRLESAADDTFVNPVTNIISRHDEAQIRLLQQQGKIQDGFPDVFFAHIPKTGGDAITLASAALFPYGFGLRPNWELSQMVEIAKQGPEYCFFEHLPPQYVTKFYGRLMFEKVYKERTVFCVARSPYERLVSEWHMCHEYNYPGNCGEDCDAAGLNKYVQTELRAFQEGDYFRNACFLIPQTDYMEGDGGCQKVLDFGNLRTDFHDFMQEKGYNISLPQKQETHRQFKNRCSHITAANLSVSSLKLIEEVYSRDFEEFGARFNWTKLSDTRVSSIVRSTS